ncbi:MAG: glycine cleavage system aminomethyltransferase GcvT [Clostridia bacterium]|nr:glycine cleavage system aminomethyltransferase GcvT [Clostridia bacterium]
MIKLTPLYDFHLTREGKIVEFAGYYLPIQYPTGIVAEHNAVRNNAGLFDVSHMGEFEITGDNCLQFLNNLLSNDFTDLTNNHCRYSLMLNDNGGMVDDLLVYKFNDNKYWLIVNAGNKDKDAEWVNSHLIKGVNFTDKSDLYGQVALQGPKAEHILAKITDRIPTENYTFIDGVELFGQQCVLSRTGYTGEDGFEIYIPSSIAIKVAEAIELAGKDDGLLCCGLGCRDTLRFEASMPLYGHELTEDYLATEVGLAFAIKMTKPKFIGRQALEQNEPIYRRRGVELIDRGIAREHSPIYDGDNLIGEVTTGTMSPTLGKAIAMVRILKSYKGDTIEIDVRGRRLKAKFVKMPFYKR